MLKLEILCTYQMQVEDVGYEICDVRWMVGKDASAYIPHPTSHVHRAKAVPDFMVAAEY
jgi:hypothetical protein